MSCAIAEQITEHTNADSQAEANIEINQLALSNLFNQDLPEGNFSAGCINLFDATKEAIKQDPEFTTEVIVEMLVAKNTDIKKYQLLRGLFRSRVSIIALEMNEEMAKRH